jgi:hypothetical protein
MSASHNSSHPSRLYFISINSSLPAYQKIFSSSCIIHEPLPAPSDISYMDVKRPFALSYLDRQQKPERDIHLIRVSIRWAWLLGGRHFLLSFLFFCLELTVSTVFFQ